MNHHRASGSYERGRDRWRGDHSRGSPGRGGTQMHRSSRDDEFRSQRYAEQGGRRYGGPVRDEDWPDPTHDYARGGYGGDYDRSDEERHASGYEEGNYPGVGNYQDVGGRPGGGYASGEGFEDRDYGTSRSGSRDYESGGYRHGYESGAQRQGMRDYDESGYARRLTGSSRGMPGSDDRSSVYGAMSGSMHGGSTAGGGYGGSRGQQGYGSGGYGEGRYGSAGDGRRMQGGFHGKGPKNYTRSDERIREDLSERLYEDDMIDASDVTIDVNKGVVRLSGTVDERWLKHRVEDMAESCSGVKDVENQLRVRSGAGESLSGSGVGASGSSSGTSGTSGTGSGPGSGASGMGSRTS
jgi:hypothetical protein